MHLERERVLKDLQEQEQQRAALRQGLAQEQQNLADMQKRMAAGEAVSEKEREAATKELERLSDELKHLNQRHAQSLADAEKLGITPGAAATEATP